MSTPNWASLTDLKGPMYLNLKDTDVARDAALLLLCQMVTDQMISYLDSPTLDVTAPSLALKRACLEQCCFEWKQRATVGLQSVQMQDGSINKYQIKEWLESVERILGRVRFYPIYENARE